jgi:cyclophilin family peptidyl-prolyl cis-trans isomerase
MPSSNRRTRDRQLARQAARRADERRRQQRQRIWAGVIGALIATAALAIVYFVFLRDNGAPAAGPSPSASASASPTTSPSPTATGPGSQCGYTTSAAATGPNGPMAIPQFTVKENKTYIATVKTSMGTFHLELYDNQAPCAVNSFVSLARQGFYDGLTFHRVVKDFVIQGGDPTGTGSGGPGYTFNDELDNDLTYEPGTLAMANSGPNTNGSQWFVVASENGAKQLTKNYTIFGHVSQGLDVVTKINEVPVDSNETPVDPVTIEKITIQEMAEQS